MNSINNNNNNKNQTNNQKPRSISSIKGDGEHLVSYYDHHRKRELELTKRRNRAALNSMFFSSNL